jgi:acetoin utilization deacetylase AcuC-like enzyme
MDIIYSKIFLEHNTGIGHPECRERLEAFGNLTETKIESGEAFIELIHTRDYVERVKEACSYGMPLDGDTQTSAKSFAAAAYAVGAAIKASQTNGFALVRPPGHHSYPTYGSGFCLFNNIAIATQKLVNEGKRVFILDFDGHLGDGTLNIFYNTDKVLFWSLHQYPAFPGGGFADEIGEGKGKGFSVNVPLPAGSGDDLFMHAINNFMPIAEQFSPDVVAVSAGFDAYRQDPLLQLTLSMNTFYEIGTILKSKFKNVFAVLEGGYNTEYLPKCAFNFLAGINGEEIKYKEEWTKSAPQIIKEYEKRAELLKTGLNPYWDLSKINTFVK